MEITLNNRALSYVEDGVLTPNHIIFGQSNLLPEVDGNYIEETKLRKRARYLRRCKDLQWSKLCERVREKSKKKAIT